MERASKK